MDWTDADDVYVSFAWGNLGICAFCISHCRNKRIEFLQNQKGE